MALSELMDQESRRLLDYARTSFDRLMQRRVMFLGGVLISVAYFDWIVGLIGFLLCYSLDYVEMKACSALLKARDLLTDDPDLRETLRKRLHLAASASTFAVVLFVVGTFLRAPEDLQFIPVMFLISAALYWTISQNQIADIVTSRSIIVGSGVLIILAAPMIVGTLEMALTHMPKALTMGCVFYFIHVCAHAYAASYDRSLDQILAVERSLQEAAQSDQHKSDLLRILSHELRTPLNGVLGMAQLMSLGQLSSQQRAQLSTISASGNQLDQLISEVMDSERLNTGRLRIIKEPVQLTAFINATLDRHRKAADAKGLRFEVEALTDLPDQVVIDAGRVAQCLDHLLSNAVKFTNVGYVKVSCAHNALPGPPRLTFKVKDTGIGMPRAMLDHIFQRFAQEDMSESRSYGGMGLGLWTSKVMADLMGGSLGVNSRQGSGSTFTLNLIAEAVTTERTGTGASPQRTGGQAIDLAS